MRVFFCVFFLTVFQTVRSQSIDSILLKDSELPSGYRKVDKLLCVTPHAESFYEQSELYESFLGKIVKKEFQSFQMKGDEGSVLYFEFEKEFTGQAFLDGLLWGQSKKPTKSKPDEYFAKGKFLVIWSFKLQSEIKRVSKAKIETSSL